MPGGAYPLKVNYSHPTVSISNGSQLLNEAFKKAF
jgi:hypothetical protein